MGKLSGKKLLLLGERDGVPGPAMADVFANSGAEVLFSATECFEGAEIYAETVTLGDPTFAGPLAGVPLGLCVCHVLEPEIKAEADAAKWDEQIGMMEMVLNVDALADAVRKMREANSKYPL